MWQFVINRAFKLTGWIQISNQDLKIYMVWIIPVDKLYDDGTLITQMNDKIFTQLELRPYLIMTMDMLHGHDHLLTLWGNVDYLNSHCQVNS